MTERDPDNPPLTEEFSKNAVRGRKAAREKLVDGTVSVSIWLSPEVLAFYRATGDGWQMRINDTLLAIVRNARRHDEQTHQA